MPMEAPCWRNKHMAVFWAYRDRRDNRWGAEACFRGIFFMGYRGQRAIGHLEHLVQSGHSKPGDYQGLSGVLQRVNEIQGNNSACDIR